MKIAQSLTSKFRNTYKSERIKFAISKTEQKHIMGMLRDQIYSDKILAPIREYFCNAADANIEVNNQDTPIHIQLPTQMDPIWSIRDHGPGLSHEEIKNIFTKYGESTKRESNNVTGCLGIGSKSAFAYTDQFTVETYLNGTKSTYVAAINDEADAIIHLASQNGTAEHNGVRISIPVKADDIYTFKKRTLRYLSSIHLAGTPYKILNEEVEALDIEKVYEANDASWYIIKTDQDTDYEMRHGNCRIIMGHVAYPLDTEQLHKLPADIRSISECSSLYIRIPLGCLSIAASRESLEYNEQTMAYLTSTLPIIKESVQGTLCSDIIKAENKYEATKLYNSAQIDLPYHLKKVLEDLVHEKSGEKVSTSVNFYTKLDPLDPSSTRQPLHCIEYTWKSLRNGTKQINRRDRQHLRPNLNTTLFLNDKKESKSLVGRRVRAYMTDNPSSELLLIHHTKEELKNTTISDFAEDIPSINEVAPLPINYSTKGTTRSATPSKAYGELFLVNKDKLSSAANMNRDCFEMTNETLAKGYNTKLYSIQINGFRYAGKDLKYGDDDRYASNLITELSLLLESILDTPHVLVAYRPKHEAAFDHITPFFDAIIKKLKDYLKGSPDIAYEILLFRTRLKNEINNCDDRFDHDLDDLIEHLGHSKNPALRQLYNLYDHWTKVNDNKNMPELHRALEILEINPQTYTRKKIPLIGALTTKVLEQQPILQFIKTPYSYHWRRNADERTKFFKETLKNNIR